MKRDKRKIKFAVGISGKSIIVSEMLMLALLLVPALAGCRFSSEERLVKRSNLFETYRMPYVKEEEKKIFNFFYCTDRGTIESEDPLLSYGTELTEELRLGTFKVHLSPERDLRGDDPDNWSGIEVRNVQALQEETFFGKLQYAVESSPHKSLAVLVFGYRNSFEDALLKGGKLAVNLDIHTPFLIFDWPADQGLGFGGYKKAFSFAERSGVFLGELLANIIRRIKPQKLWLGGGSLGSQVICNAFAQMMTHPDLADREKEIDHVFLAAPDVADDEFNAQFKDEIAALARAVTVYVSSDDKALLLSEWIHGQKRLGRTRPEKQEQFEEMIDLLELEAKGAEEITVIDVSPINRATLGHTFYIESSEFYDDLYRRLLNTNPEKARRLYRTDYRDGAAYWIMRDDEE
ncbi:MAG: alpha/beta hydrolase [Deltaproteobacteria bacterium]|nr:alpha/beta hydrolase [Deltaproteobacteria bacterium]